MTTTLIAHVLFTLALLAAWFWSHRRDRTESLRIAAELAECRSTLHEFMRETEATFAVLSRLVHKTGVSTRTAGTVSVTSRILPDNAPAKAQVADAVRPASSVPARGAGKTTQVLKMADKGMTALEIASQLAIPQGEIDLILNLNGRAACA